MRVGFILLDKKRPRVLTCALTAAAEQHGVELAALDPSSPEQWHNASVDVIVHKVPEDHELDARLTSFQACHPNVVLLDPPTAVRALQHREAMLAPLAGRPLVLSQCPSCLKRHRTANQTQQQLQHGQLPDIQQQSDYCVISTPGQVTLHPGCSSTEALQMLSAAGIKLPALVKPLTSVPTDAASVATAATHVDGHALGVVYTQQGIGQLLQGDVPELSLPVVIQQYVPHGQALYKLYVIGPHVVLTRRSTLTMEMLKAAAAAAATENDSAGSSTPGVVLLQRVSAVPLPSPAVTGACSTAAATATAAGDSFACNPRASNHAIEPHQHAEASSSFKTSPQSQQGLQGSAKQQQVAAPAASTVHEGGLCCKCVGTALMDASVVGDVGAPPVWAMQQLAEYLRQKLQVNLFNVDIIAPEQSTASHASLVQELLLKSGQITSGSIGSSCSHHVQEYFVVDVNFFPGYDKVPGAEQLFADYLASLKQAGNE